MALAAERLHERTGTAGTLDAQQNPTPDEHCRAHRLFMAYGNDAKGFHPEEWILPASVPPSYRRCRAHCLYMACGDYSKGFDP
jgi:hypothetical protein